MEKILVYCRVGNKDQVIESQEKTESLLEKDEKTEETNEQ